MMATIYGIWRAVCGSAAKWFMEGITIKLFVFDLLKALFWAALIIIIVLFSTGGYQTFIYQNF